MKNRFALLVLLLLVACSRSKTVVQPTGAVADPLAVPNACGLANMVAAGNFVSYDWRITANHFPVNTNAYSVAGTKIFRFEVPVTTGQVIASMQAEGFVPSRLERVLAYGKQKQGELAGAGSVIGLGSHWTSADGMTWAPAVHMRGGPGVELTPTTTDTVWQPYYWFLGTPEKDAGVGTAADAPTACTFALMIENGLFEAVDERITATAFSVDPARYTVANARLTTNDVVREGEPETLHRVDGNMSAGIEALLAYAKHTLGHRTTDRATIAHGASWVEDGDTVYACLYGNEIGGCRSTGWEFGVRIGQDGVKSEKIRLQYLLEKNPYGAVYKPNPANPGLPKRMTVPDEMVKDGQVFLPSLLTDNPELYETTSYGIDETPPPETNMWGDEIGDAFGAGGLGLSGIGEKKPSEKIDDSSIGVDNVPARGDAWGE